MGERFPTLVLVAALLTVPAIAQEIVIEPTNGRAPTANHLSRPDVSRSAAERAASVETTKSGTKYGANPEAKSGAKSGAKAEAKSIDKVRGAARAKAKKIQTNQIAAKPKAAPAETKPADSVAPEGLKSEAVEVAPAPKKALEPRPAWAITDTRDSGVLQSEIASALARDPRLAGSAIQVSVDDASVTLEGRATGSRQHLQAQRLAKSYAWNRKLVDRIQVDRVQLDRSQADHSDASPSMAAKK